jgi:hypothetical protein
MPPSAISPNVGLFTQSPLSQVLAGSVQIGPGEHSVLSFRKTWVAKPGDTLASPALVTMDFPARIPVAATVAVKLDLRFWTIIVQVKVVSPVAGKSFGRRGFPSPVTSI